MNECQTKTANEYTSIYIKKRITGDAHKYFIEQIRYVGETQPYYLRNENNFRLPRTTTIKMQMSLLYKVLHLHNMQYVKQTNIFN